MKRILTKLIIFAALVCSAVSLRAATPVTAAYDYQFTQRKADNSAWESIIFAKQNGGIFVTTASGVPSILAAGTNGYFLSMVGGVPTWVAGGGGGGGVSSVGLSLPNIFTVSGSPVTSSGTLTGTLATQTANMVFAGPTTGSAATPAFRALVNADIPANTKPVATITALKALSVSGLTTGFPVRVTTLDRVFTYSSTDTRPGNDVTIVTPDVGSGRWDVVITVNDYNKNFTTQGREYLAHFHTLLMNGSAAKAIFSGDSTTEGGTGNGIVNPTLNNISNVVGTMLQAAYPAITTVNAGHSSQSTVAWLSTYLAADLAQNPDLYVIRWGINDGSLNPDTFLSNLETGLLTIRQSKSAAQMSILLMSPNSTNDNPLGRNQAWYERVVPALPILARKYQCAYLDTYSILIDSMNAITAMDAPYAGIVAATSLVNGTRYQILSVGSTDFTAVGAAANIVGTIFTATGAGTGTGTAASMVSAGSFVVGTDYTIGTIGTTDFTLIGAAYNAVGLTFTATGVGTGTGKASLGTHIHPHDVMNRWIGSQVYDLISPSGIQRLVGLNNVTAIRSDAATPNVTDTPNSYPYGVSMARAITAGGWVLDGGIFTQRTPDEVVLQIVNDYTFSSAFKVRSAATPTTWNDWQYFINSSGASLTAGTTPASYQKGWTTNNVLASNGWPTNGTVFSFIDAAGTVSQLLIDSTGASQTRQSTSSSAWSSWSVAAAGTVLSIPDGSTNGVTWTVATRTTTPTFTFSLGAITPSSITTSTASLGVTSAGNTTVTGILTLTGSRITTANALTSTTTIQIAQVNNTKTISGDTTFTFSGTAAAQQWLGLELINSDSNTHTITFPSSFSLNRQTTVTTTTIAASGRLSLSWWYDGSVYRLYGDSALTSGTGSFVLGTGATISGPDLTLLASASPTTSATARTAFKTNAWATGFGAVQIYNGTANTYLVGVEASDTPTNGQVPTWNTGGTITWETPAGGASLTSTYIGYGVAGALGGEAAFTYTAASNTATIGAVSLGAGGETSSIGTLVDPVDGVTPLNNIIETVASGTAYTLTTSYAALDFGTTDPVVTISNAGTYTLYFWVQTSLVSATTTTQSVQFKLRRTNNTAADLGSVSSAPLPVATIGSQNGPQACMIAVKYTTTNTNDSITIQGQTSAALGAGTVTVTDARIVAIRAYAN